MRILIEGTKVQEIGYRLFLLEKALENGIGRIYAKNVDDDKLELLVDDVNERLENFYQVVLKDRPKGAMVDNIAKEPYSGDMQIPSIDRYFQFLTLDQMSRGREEIIRLPGFVGSSLEKLTTALGGIDQKFGEVIDRFGVFGEQAKGMNYKLEKQGERLGSMDDKLGGIDDKLNTLPERIAEAIYSKEKKN
jgi:acylphosphatase